MLKISSINNAIIISNTEVLKKYQISQLEYYGFKMEISSLLNYSENIEYEVLKIVNYFDEENLEYELSDIISNLIQSSFERKNDFERILSQAKKIKDLAVLDEPFNAFTDFANTLPRKLKAHQIKSAYHFYTLGNGANFSVPGSGKTSTILTVYEKLKREGKCNILFIVGPPSCFQPWKNEFYETLGRVPNSMILSGGDISLRKNEYFTSSINAYELYLSTFQTVLNDYKDIIKFLSNIGINVFLIVDEAHYIKQLGGSWANSLLEIGRYAIYKGVLTGTPMPKSYRDIYNLFDFLWEENSPISQADRIQIETWEKGKKNEEIKSLLHARIGPLFYRVRKKDLGLIPAIFHVPIVVKMNDAEKAIYNFVNAKIFDLNQNEYFKNEVILNKLWSGRMMRLRQSVSYPKLLFSAIDDYSENFFDNSSLVQKIRDYDQIEIPAKLLTLTIIVQKLKKKQKKVLIWSNFIGTLELIKKHFNSLGDRAELIYGKTPIRRDDSISIKEEKTREDIRDEFLDTKSGLDILIANPAACAESISLHKTCFHAIYYDLSYNCAHYLQSLDRIHRVGGSEINEANYYFLQYENSIDQDIKRNLDSKAHKMYDLIEQDYNIYDLDLNGDNEVDDIEAYKRLFITK